MRNITKLTLSIALVSLSTIEISCGRKVDNAHQNDSDSLPPIVKYLVEGENQDNQTDIYYIGDSSSDDSIVLYTYPMRDDTIRAKGAEKMIGDGLNFSGNVVKAKIEKNKDGEYIVTQIDNLDSRFTHTMNAIIGEWYKVNKGKQKKKEKLILKGDGTAEGMYHSWEFAEPPTDAHTQTIILIPQDDEADDDTLSVDLNRLEIKTNNKQGQILFKK